MSPMDEARIRAEGHEMGVAAERSRIVALIRREADIQPDESLTITHAMLLATVRRLADQIAGAKGLHVEPLDSAGPDS